MTFLLSAARATMNINMNPGRGNIAFFPFHWAIHAQKKSIQVNLMGNLCACAWLCEQCSPCSTSPLPPAPSLCLLAVKNTLRQVQLWQTLQYGNQIGLNACKELDTNNYQPTLCISLSVFTQGPLFLLLFLWCSEISSQRDANLPTSFLPFPHLQTQIAPGQSQVFLYAEPVTGVTHHSPHVPSLTSCEPLALSLALPLFLAFSLSLSRLSAWGTVRLVCYGINIMGWGMQPASSLYYLLSLPFPYSPFVCMCLCVRACARVQF